MHIPHLKPKPFKAGEKLRAIKELPDWAQSAFKVGGGATGKVGRDKASRWEATNICLEVMDPSLFASPAGHRQKYASPPSLPPLPSPPTFLSSSFPLSPPPQGMDSLNRVQSAVCDAALFSGENLLICAPTGAGKTNVAMLCVLHQVNV